MIQTLNLDLGMYAAKSLQISVETLTSKVKQSQEVVFKLLALLQTFVKWRPKNDQLNKKAMRINTPNTFGCCLLGPSNCSIDHVVTHDQL